MRAGRGLNVPPPPEDGLTRDALLGGKIWLHQPARGVRAGSDAVFLAAACPAQSGESVLEIGCATGAALLCLGARVPGARLAGLEVQPDLAALARRNASENAMADRMRVIEGDLKAIPKPFGHERFDHVIANPPFFSGRNTRASPHAGRALARTEAADGDLQAWIGCMLQMAKPTGGLTLIFVAERVAELLAHLTAARETVGSVETFPLWPRVDQPAKRMIVRARKGDATPPRVHAGLVLHETDGAYTAPAEAILRGGKALSFEDQLP
jgi:tRNA1(Val) A37 N6-methylase TrmN6